METTVTQEQREREGSFTSSSSITSESDEGMPQQQVELPGPSGITVESSKEVQVGSRYNYAAPVTINQFVQVTSTETGVATHEQILQAALGAPLRQQDLTAHSLERTKDDVEQQHCVTVAYLSLNRLSLLAGKVHMRRAMKLLRHRHRSCVTTIVNNPAVSRPRLLSPFSARQQKPKGAIQSPRSIPSSEHVSLKQHKPAEKYCVLQILWSLFVIFLLISICLGTTIGVQWKYVLPFSESTSLEFKTEAPPLTEIPTTYEPFVLPDHQFYTCKEWGAINDESAEILLHPTPIVVISHTHERSCDSFEICKPTLQHLNMSWNFLISSDGSIYEGRGWDKQSLLHVPEGILAVSFIGNFNRIKLTSEQVNAAQQLLAMGVTTGKLHSHYKIVAQGQIDGTNIISTTGKNVLTSISKWPHYDPNFRVPS